MGKMSIIFLIIIVLYLLYAFIKSRPKNKIKEGFKVVQNDSFNKGKSEKKDVNELERYAVVAAIAAVMGDAQYKINKIFLTANVDEKKSSWKIAGRNESMMRRVFFK